MACLLERIASEYAGLSSQLRTVAQRVAVHRENLAIVKIRILADECNVPPSTIIRFAKRFGYSGFSDMQVPFRVELTRRLNSHRRNSEVAQFGEVKSPTTVELSEIAKRAISACRAEIDSLGQLVNEGTIDDVATLLSATEQIWICGSEHALPAVFYFDYLLGKAGVRVRSLPVVGASNGAAPSWVSKGDVLIVISSNDEESALFEKADDAKRRGAGLIAITGSRTGELADLADVLLVTGALGGTYANCGLSSLVCLIESLWKTLCVRLKKEEG